MASYDVASNVCPTLGGGGAREGPAGGVRSARCGAGGTQRHCVIGWVMTGGGSSVSDLLRVMTGGGVRVSDWLRVMTGGGDG